MYVCIDMYACFHDKKQNINRKQYDPLKTKALYYIFSPQTKLVFH